MKKIIGAFSVLAVMPGTASMAAVAFGDGGAAPVQTAAIYNADSVRAAFIAPSAPANLKAAAPMQNSARAVSGSFGVSPGVINAPGNSGGSNVVADTPAGNLGTGGGTGSNNSSNISVNQCMGNIETCVNSTLPGGIRNLFDENMRNSIFNGMNLCQDQVEDCKRNVYAEVRLADGSMATTLTPIYRNNIDVWVDFNARVIQPQYYSFTLGRTGLTPRQAEAVCKLLDRNTFGSSFAAVGINNQITTEYNQGVNSYNDQGAGSYKGDKSSDQPMGADINMHNKVDAMRGYYGRWDAEQAECLVRVAAYNGNDLIQNRWQVGIKIAGVDVGDGKWAEQWIKSGEGFKCGKSLFGFSLLNETAENAVAGAIIGGATGAVIGMATTNNTLGDGDIDCSNDTDRKNFMAVLKELKVGCDGKVNQSVCEVEIKGAAEAASIPAGWSMTNSSQCRAVLEKIRESDDLATIEAAWADKNFGKGARAAIGGGIGAAGGAGLASAITYFVESNNITCRVGDNLEKVGYDKSFSIPTLKDFYVKWALNLPDSTSSNPIPVMNRADWVAACGSAVANDRASCQEMKVNYRREGLITGMQVWNACTWTGDERSGSCGINRITCLSYGVCTLQDVQ
ncbi:MAG: hypothetical protein LBG89_03600 [Rickettsiales bacterium]|jgi:hypothetical protein|nr:hypothetical protein [Rickettsiales bacterium]